LPFSDRKSAWQPVLPDFNAGGYRLVSDSIADRSVNPLFFDPLDFALDSTGISDLRVGDRTDICPAEIVGSGKSPGRKKSMQRYSFSVKEGKFAGLPVTAVLSDLGAAKREAVAMCVDLMPAVLRTADLDFNWRMEVADQTGKLVYRLKLLAEPLPMQQPI
jgi:hypothetical protein